MQKKSTAKNIIELPQSKTESTEKTNTPSDKFISPKNQDLLTRIGVYSLNIGSRLLSKAYESKEAIGNLAKESIEIGNFYGGIVFAGLDVLARKNTWLKRVLKSGGFAFYVGSCGYDLIMGKNDFENIWYHLGNFALDTTMAIQLGKDMGSLYNEESETEIDKPHSLRADLKSLWPFGKSKDKNENNDKNLESKVSESGTETDSNKKTESVKSKFKDYLSAFGKGIGYGALAGYSFGYSAFETLKENYSNYKTKQKEKKELKRIENEKKKKEKEEQKIKEKKDNEIKNALEKIRKANKKKMKTREDEVSLIKYGGATLEDLKNREEKGKSRYEI